MQVKLEANWFGPDGRRYRKNQTGERLTYIPDELAKFLPSTARIVEQGGEFPAIEISDPGLTLRAWDQDRAVSDAEGQMVEKAETNRTAEQRKGEIKQKRLAALVLAREAKRLKNA